MRFIIPKGKKLGSALESLIAFLDKTYKDYPYAAGNINIYFNLCGDTKFPEGENNKEFVMDKDGSYIDSDSFLIEEAFRDTLWRVDNFIKQYLNCVSHLQHKLSIKEQCRREALEKNPDDKLKLEAWDIQIEKAKGEIRNAFFLELLAGQLKKLREGGKYIRYSRVMSYHGSEIARDKTFKDCIAAVQFEGLEGLSFTGCFFINGRNNFFEGRFEEERDKRRFF